MKQKLEFILKGEPVLRFNRFARSGLTVDFESVEGYIKNSGFGAYKPSIVEFTETNKHVAAMIYQKGEGNPKNYVAIIQSNGTTGVNFEFLVYSTELRK